MVGALREETAEEKTLGQCERGTVPGGNPSSEFLSWANTESLTSVCQKEIPGPRPLDHSLRSLQRLPPPLKPQSINSLFTSGLLWDYIMCVLTVYIPVCAPWTCVSSFALYSWLLMASSTPYPDRWTFSPLGFWTERRGIIKKVRDRNQLSLS